MDTESRTNKPLHPLAWIAGIALILFSAAGIGAFMGWIPTSMGDPGEKLALETKPAAAPARTKAAAPAQRAEQTEQRAERTVQLAQVVAAPAMAARARCDECGVIESVREIDTKGKGTGLGAVGGAVVGGLLGNQVGGGRGQDVMTVVGAVGGAVAGNEVEKRTKSTRSYSITVRLEDGTSRVISQADAPSWRAGDKVKVVNGIIQSNA